MFDAYELGVLAGLNFSSVFAALLVLKALEARRKRKAVRVLMEELGEKIELEQNFSDIIRKNFKDDGGPDES